MDKLTPNEIKFIITHFTNVLQNIDRIYSEKKKELQFLTGDYKDRDFTKSDKKLLKSKLTLNSIIEKLKKKI